LSSAIVLLGFVGTGTIACATERQRRRPEASGSKGARNGERRYELLTQHLDCDARAACNGGDFGAEEIGADGCD